MAAFPYTTVPGHLQKFMKHITSTGVPQKVTYKYLKQVGFTSSNDRSIRDILQFIGFLDHNYAPTDRWKAYRDKRKRKVALARGIKEGYSALYHTYPDAHRKDNEALTNFFRAHTEVGERALSGMVSTFNTLAELADFDALEQEDGGAPEPAASAAEELEEAAPRRTAVTRAATRDGLIVNLNVELTVPETDDAEIYDKFFAAMKKHLLSD